MCTTRNKYSPKKRGAPGDFPGAPLHCLMIGPSGHSIVFIEGGDIVARMSEDVAQLAKNALFAVGTLDDIGCVLELFSRVGYRDRDAGLFESGKIIEIVAKIDRLLLFNSQ